MATPSLVLSLADLDALIGALARLRQRVRYYDDTDAVITTIPPLGRIELRLAPPPCRCEGGHDVTCGRWDR